MIKPFTIETNYSSYRVFRTLPQQTKEISNFCNELQLPFLKKTIADIIYLNSQKSENLKEYAYELLSFKKFSITCPIFGNKINVRTSYTFSDFQTIFFLPTENEPVGIVASDLAAGFPLSSIIIFEKKIIIHITDSFWGFGERNLTALAERGDSTIDLHKNITDICLISGDPNFAHHAWNELSTLQEISEAGLDAGTSLAVIHEPLGPVNEILGSRFNILEKRARAYTPDLNKLQFLTFCASGTKITSRLCEKILNFSRNHLSDEAKEIHNASKEHDNRTLWISIRTRNRTLASQEEIFSDIILKYLESRPDRMVIIDGHSLPFDHDDDPSYLQIPNEASVLADMKVAEGIIQNVKTQIPTAKIYNFVGKSIHESIYIATNAGIYFCHHGTVQHKIGWFSSVKGIVHCNREVLGLRPDGWVKQQSEIAALPIYIPDHLVEDLRPDDICDELQQHLMHTNYRITDTEELTDLICKFAADNEKL